MGRGGNKKNAQIRVANLQIKKRNGILVAVAAFIGLAVIIALKLMLQGQGFEWLNSTFANMGIFIVAIVCAGIAGWGTRTWNRARKEIAIIQSRSKK